MENNAIINARLKDLLEVLDMRATVNIFINEDGDLSIRYAEVYKIAADKEFIKTYGDREVIGFIRVLNVTNIMIEEV